MKDMTRRVLIIPILLVIGSCTASRTETSPMDVQSAEPTPATAAFVRDGKGNVIKASGWQVPILPEDRKYEPIVLEFQGRRVSGLTSWFAPKEKMVVTIPNSSENGEVTYRVIEISELKVKDQPPYCYNFTVTDDWPDPTHHPAVSTFFAYRDDDGDGIFETLAQGCGMPKWIK